MDTGEALFDEVHHVGACFEDSIDTSAVFSEQFDNPSGCVYV